MTSDKKHITLKETANPTQRIVNILRASEEPEFDTGKWACYQVNRRYVLLVRTMVDGWQYHTSYNTLSLCIEAIQR